MTAEANPRTDRGTWVRVLVRGAVLTVVLLGLVAFSVLLAKVTLTPSPASADLVTANLRPGRSLRQYAEDYTFLAACKQAGGNLLLGVPFGLLLPFFVPRRLRMIRTTLLTAVAMSVVELIQGALVEGRAFDIDDVILNTAGALLGYFVLGRRISHRYYTYTDDTGSPGPSAEKPEAEPKRAPGRPAVPRPPLPRPLPRRRPAPRPPLRRRSVPRPPVRRPPVRRPDNGTGRSRRPRPRPEARRPHREDRWRGERRPACHRVRHRPLPARPPSRALSKGHPFGPGRLRAPRCGRTVGTRPARGWRPDPLPRRSDMAEGQWSPGRKEADADEFRPVLDIVEPARQRRLTVLLRLLLLIPHFIVLFVLHIAAFFTVIVGWFAALVLGRLPDPVFRFLTGVLGYDMRVSASDMLLIDRYPPFA